MAVGFDVNPIQPVAAQIKPPQGMSLADMVNMAGGIQQYQQAQKMNPLQLEQQRSITGTAEEQRQQAILGTAEKQLGLNQKKFKTIADSQIAMINDPEIVAAEAKPNAVNRDALVAKVRKAGLTLAANVGIPPEEAETLIQPYVDLAANDPGKLRGYVKQRHILGLDEAARTAVLSPSGMQISTGAGGYSVSTNPFGEQQPGQVIPSSVWSAQLAPGSRLEATGRLDANNVPTAYLKSPDGTVVAEVPIPTGPMPSPGMPAASTQPAPAPAQAAPPRGPAMPAVGPQAATGGVRRLPPGETQDTYAAANKIRLDAQTAATSVPQQLFNNNQIVGIITSGDVATGKGAQTLANLGGGFAAIPWSTDSATNLNQLGHYMSLQTGNLASSAGFNTDSSRAIAQEQTGTTEWTADAIKKTARVNRTLATISDYFNRGAQNAYAKTKDPFAVRDFRDTWGQTLDMDAARLIDASRNKEQDPTGLAEVAIELGGVNSPRYKNALKKVGDLRKLIRGE
jgi:hypothetical protein